MDSSYFRSGIPRGVDNFRVNASYPEEPCIDGDDLPYWIEGKSEKEKHLVIPYTLDVNDMRFATPQGFNSGDQFFNYLKDSFDALYLEGETHPKMMSVGMHARILGRPGRIMAMRKFLEYVRTCLLYTSDAADE